MKNLTIPLLCGVGLALAAVAPFVIVPHASEANAARERPERPPVHQNKLLKQKRKIAGDLCYAAMQDGAWRNLDADDLSDYCIHVATHIVDAPYDHTDETDQ